MSRILPKVANESSGFPRVSGDEPINEVSSFDLEMFSPRERG